MYISFAVSTVFLRLSFSIIRIEGLTAGRTFVMSHLATNPIVNVFDDVFGTSFQASARAFVHEFHIRAIEDIRSHLNQLFSIADSMKAFAEASNQSLASIALVEKCIDSAQFLYDRVAAVEVFSQFMKRDVLLSLHLLALDDGASDVDCLSTEKRLHEVVLRMHHLLLDSAHITVICGNK